MQTPQEDRYYVRLAAAFVRGRRPRPLIWLVLSLLVVIAGVLLYLLFFTGQPPPTRRDAIGQVTLFAGAGIPARALPVDGQLREASFSDPFGVTVDAAGNVYIADGGDSNRIRRITGQGVVETVAGAAGVSQQGAAAMVEDGFADGAAGEAKFNTPSALAMDEDDNLFIADTANHRIRRLDAKGQVTTVAGTGAAGFGDGAAGAAMFDAPIGVAVDKLGNLFVADTYNDRIRKISPDGEVTTIAGTGTPGYREGAALEAQFDTPCAVAVDKLGNVFVADTGNDAVRKITPQGEVLTVFSEIPAARGEAAAEMGTHGDGAAGEALRLERPIALAITHDNFLFVVCEGDGRVYRVTPEGEAMLYADGGKVVSGKTPMRSAAGVAVDGEGNLYVTDNRSYLIWKIAPVAVTAAASSSTSTTAATTVATAAASSSSSSAAVSPSAEPSNGATAGGESDGELFMQPVYAQEVLARASAEKLEALVPRLNASVLQVKTPFPYPLAPQDGWHEVAGTVGEARGAFDGTALHHLHSGLDFAGQMGAPCLAVLDEKVSAPLSTWGYNGTGEGISVGLMKYIHIRVGRNGKDEIQDAAKFKARVDEAGQLAGVRVRRGTRFRVGDFLGTLNRLYHVHMNLGPWNAEANALQLPFANFKDTVSPVVEPNGVEIVDTNNQPFKERANGRLLVTGDVKILVTAYDQVDGNRKTRKLGLYRLGYQILNEDGAPVSGFASPLFNIEFNRLPPGDAAVTVVYAQGSGVSAYGTPTKFKYIVTNRVRDGEAREGRLRTAALGAGNYQLRIFAEDYAGNRATGKTTELAFTIK